MIDGLPASMMLVGRHWDEPTIYRAAYAFDARNQAIGRIGLPAVRQFRRRRLQSEYEARLAALDDMKSSVPELNAVAMVRIDATAGKSSERAS